MIKPAKETSPKEVLEIIIRKQGKGWEVKWVTSSLLSKWTQWTTREAKQALEKLAEMGYAVKSGRQGRSERVESSGTTCVTFDLRSDRVKRWLKP